MKRGFTLIEMLVSIGIFALVMVLALGSLLSVSAAERKAEAIKTVMDNLNFALDSISRSVRYGENYHCGIGSYGGGTITPLSCPNGGTSIVFLAYDGSTVFYNFETNAATCGQSTATGGCITRKVITSQGADSGYQTITAPEVMVTNLMLYVKGAELNDNLQPKVTITLNGYSTGANGLTTPFAIQTSVTQRIYDQ
jgi:prepilin-type N-terminal cleavage/methylation domain-containing protein